MLCEPVIGSTLSRPGEPTEAPPGSELKVRIMIERAARRESLFHPLDGLPQEGRAQAPAAQAPLWVVDQVADDLEADLLEHGLEELEQGSVAGAEPPHILPLSEYVERANIA